MTIVCLIISFHSMLVTNGAYSKIELSDVELTCNYVSKAKIDRYTVYDYYCLRIWLLCKSLDDKDQIDGIWYDSSFFFFSCFTFLCCVISQHASDPDATISGYLYKWHKDKKWKKYWFVMKDKVLYTFKASEVRKEAYTVYSTILDSLTILNIELLHAVLLKAFEVFFKKYLHVHDYCVLQQLLVILRKALVEICCKKCKSQWCIYLMQLFNWSSNDILETLRCPWPW